MKIIVYILSITQAISLTWIIQEWRFNNWIKINNPHVLNKPVLQLREEAELLPDIQTFEEAMRGGPKAELFPKKTD